MNVVEVLLAGLAGAWMSFVMTATAQQARVRDWAFAPRETWSLVRLKRAKRREELRKEIEDFR